MLKFLRELYAYTNWANGRILDAAEGLTQAQLLAERGASFGSIRDTLVHTMSAQWIWLSRWQGESPTAMQDPADYPDLASIRAAWDKVEADTQAFVAALDEEQLDRPVTYTNTRGEQWTYTLQRMMVHQANHATQHRSEMAMILTEYGRSPGDLDLLVYFDVESERS